MLIMNNVQFTAASFSSFLSLFHFSCISFKIKDFDGKLLFSHFFSHVFLLNGLFSPFVNALGPQENIFSL